jgi:hypothetical protein
MPKPKKQSKKEIQAKITEMREGIKNGTIKIEPAPSEKIDDLQEKYPDYFIEFFDTVVKMNYYNVFITDMSSLHDFSDKPKTYERRIKKAYKVDVDPDGDLLIYKLIRQIFLKDKAFPD